MIRGEVTLEQALEWLEDLKHCALMLCAGSGNYRGSGVDPVLIEERNLDHKRTAILRAFVVEAFAGQAQRKVSVEAEVESTSDLVPDAG